MKSALNILLFLILSAGQMQALVFEGPGEGRDNQTGDEVSPVELSNMPSSGGMVMVDSPSPAVLPGKSPSQSEMSFPFRSHIGRVGMGSGIYLGNGFVLTSAHVGCYPFQAEDGSIYRPDYQSWTVIKGEDGTQTDLAVFQIEIPDSDAVLSRLPMVPISQSAPQKGAPVILVGTGLKQQAEPATLRSGDKVLAVLGYHLDRKRMNLAGKNSIEGSLDTKIKSGSGETYCFSTRFDRASSDAQASDGDSGGASFVYNFNTLRWELAGCIVAVTQKDGFIPFGSQTFLADLSRYRDQLPLPASNAPGSAVQTLLVSTEPEETETELSEEIEAPVEELMPM